MQDAGVDTEAVVRTGMIGFMEGAMIHGIFHGDLHGGNLFVLPDGRTALLDFGIIGRLTEPRRLAFLRLLMTATANDLTGQLEALRDLGALPPDTDIQAVIVDLGLDRPVVDPTTLSADELVNEIQQTIKALLGFGARLPKELMLFVKNMVFLDGAVATLAPDLDIFGQIGEVSMHFAQIHGERIAAELGMDVGDEYRARPQRREGQLRPRRLRRVRHLPRPPAAPRDHPRSPPEARQAAVRLVIARCSVDYEGRLSAHLPMATRLIMVKADGCVAIHADGGAYKPLNWMNAPEPRRRGRRRVDGHQPQGRDPPHHDRGGRVRQRPRPRRRTPASRRTASRRTSRSCSPTPATRWRRAWSSFAASTAPRSAPSTCCARRRGRARSPSRSSAAARSTASSSSPATSSSWTATRCSARSAGMFVAQVIKPQAKAVAAERGIVCIEVDYDTLRGIERAQTSLF